jgi:hypothetical protein
VRLRDRFLCVGAGALAGILLLLGAAILLGAALWGLPTARTEDANHSTLVQSASGKLIYIHGDPPESVTLVGGWDCRRTEGGEWGCLP